MKNNKYRYLWFILLVTSFLVTDLLAQGIKKVLNVGAVRWEIVDQADEGEGSWGWGQDKTFARGYVDEFESTKAVMMASANWTDTTGTVHPIKISGHGQWEVNDLQAVMPVPDAEGATIRRYLRRQPPSITVDGLPVEDPFPLNFTDAVAPDKIPGNADALIESFINTDMGVSIHHRVIGFAQQNHDEYMIREYTFINTGNVDVDPDIELDGQDITGFYFLKQIRPHEWQKPWCSVKGVYPGDDLRIIYGYPSRDQGSEYDNLGVPDESTGYLQNVTTAGEAILFASKGPGADFNTDDPNQPHATMYVDVDFTSFTFHSLNMTQDQQNTLYEVMQNGASNLASAEFWPSLEGTKPGVHGVPLDEYGIAYPNEMPGFGYSSSVAWSAGPYDIPFGDSVKIVIAQVYGAISPEKAWEVGQDWINDEATFGNNVIGGPDDILPQVYKDFPELYAADERSELTNWAKDNWVLSGLDSLFENARAAQFAYDNNYVIPQPPPAPSLETKNFPGYVQLTWGTESQEAADLAGYRIYRSTGRWYAGVEYGETEFLGGWELLAEVGATVNEYIDDNVQVGISQFYAVTAFDNGSQNGSDFDGINNQVLESQIAHNATQFRSESLSPAGTLDQIVIVPNPFNLAASQRQFTGEPNKITFFNVPAECTIRIFTESGDLVKKIEHAGAGTAFWGNIAEEQSATGTGQIIASGIYIAHIETPDGKSVIKKFVVVR